MKPNEEQHSLHRSFIVAGRAIATIFIATALFITYFTARYPGEYPLLAKASEPIVAFGLMIAFFTFAIFFDKKKWKIPKIIGIILGCASLAYFAIALESL